MFRLRSVLGLLAALFTSACFSTVRVPNPGGEPLPIEPGKFPHEVLDGVQKKFVNEKGRVDYQGLKADRGDLERYLQAVIRASPKSDPELFPTREDQLAYWINAYNAYVMYAITERPKLVRVEDEKVNFFYFTEYELGGDAINLYDLENEIIRPEFNDPRVHAILNCGAYGCPLLPREAVATARLDEQLTRESKNFCSNPEKVRVKGDAVEMSSIFDWYNDDFKADGGPIGFCRKHGRDDLPEGAKISYIPYDWHVNAQPGRGLYDPPGGPIPAETPSEEPSSQPSSQPDEPSSQPSSQPASQPN
jgi:hypothetical protein